MLSASEIFRTIQSCPSHPLGAEAIWLRPADRGPRTPVIGRPITSEIEIMQVSNRETKSFERERIRRGEGERARSHATAATPGLCAASPLLFAEARET